MGTLNNGTLPFGGEEGSDLTPPEEGLELYRHKDVEKLRTKNWHG